MHTQSTQRVSAMNISLTRIILDDFGEALYAVLPTASIKNLIGSATLQEHQPSASPILAGPFTDNNFDSSYHVHHHDMLGGPAQGGPTRVGPDGSTDTWYCAECGDGPLPNWNPCCPICGVYKKNGCCWTEGLHNTHRYNLLGGSAQDGPSETVWYCGYCGDGPIPDWNPCCSNCGHKKDSCCKTERI